MILYAALADIHANWPALEAVEADARLAATQEHADELRFVVLGDVVDYGPEPGRCVEWAATRAAYVVQGNHDREAAAPDDSAPIGFDPAILPALYWTRAMLAPEHLRLLRAWQPIVTAPPGLEEFTLYHSSVVVEDMYVVQTAIARRELSSLTTRYGLFGHTHYQGVFYPSRSLSNAGEIIVYSPLCTERLSWPRNDLRPKIVNCWMPLPERALINPGSVGQPRLDPELRPLGVRHSYSAAYALLRCDAGGQWSCKFVQVPYPAHETARMLLERMAGYAPADRHPWHAALPAVALALARRLTPDAAMPPSRERP